MVKRSDTRKKARRAHKTRKAVKKGGNWKNLKSKAKHVFSKKLTPLEQEQLFIAIKIGDANKVKSLIKGVSPQTLNSIKDPELKVSPLLVAAMYAGRNNDNVILPAILNSGVTITEDVKEFVRNEPPNDNKLHVLRNRINM